MSVPLASFSSNWTYAKQAAVRSVLPLPPLHAEPPFPDTIPITGSASFRFIVKGTEIEGFDDGVGNDVQFPWEAWPRQTHDHVLRVSDFYIDRAPVSCSRYASYLHQTGYTPTDARGFLREWPNWRRGEYPPGNESTPVTGVSLRGSAHLLLLGRWSAAELCRVAVCGTRGQL